MSYNGAVRLLRIVRAVLWSFFGVRRSADAARDLEGVHPAALIGVAFLLGLVLITAIATIVQLLAGKESTKRDAPVQAPAAVPKLHGPVRVRDSMEARAEACTSCHGSETQATKDGFSPRIAGKPSGYLFNQLVGFRDGRRTYPPMVYLVQYMTDDYLREMADYFAALKLPYPPPEESSLPATEAARARQIVEHGDPARDVPACVACHGATLSGTQPAIPGLRGLPRQYMNAQFGAWRQGRLRSVAPDCMAEVARRLSDEDIVLLTAWLAAQPADAARTPAPERAKLPLECGAVAAPHGNKPSPAEKTKGQYLVTVGDCIACHTAVGGAPYSGGRAIATPFGAVYSSNITPDVSTGMRAWSREDFWRALHEGRSRDGRLLYPAFPYPNFTRVTREDADAMYDYLRTLPAVSRANAPHALRFPYGTQAALSAWRMLFFREGVFAPENGQSSE